MNENQNDSPPALTRRSLLTRSLELLSLGAALPLASPALAQQGAGAPARPAGGAPGGAPGGGPGPGGGAGPGGAARPAPQPGTRLVLIGTHGGPGVELARAEASSAVVVDGVPYLVDLGYGAMRELVASTIGYAQLDSIFFTHLHDDHTSDLPALLSHQWTGSKRTPTQIYGPPGTARLVEAAIGFLRVNAEIRTVDEGRNSDPAALFHGHDVAVSPSPTLVLRDDKVAVTAVESAHYPARATAKMPHRAIALRFDTKDRAIVFTGDTAYTENIVSLAQGADILVSEIMAQSVYDNMIARAKEAEAAGNAESIARHVAETHSTPADVARMASKARVKTVVLNHLLPGARPPGGLDYAISAFIDGIRGAGFAGEVVVGQDLMVL